MAEPRGTRSKSGHPMRGGRVRPAIAAFPLVVFATVLLRDLLAGVGADEFSVLRMAKAAAAGAFPYTAYWDVRPPLAYLSALPSALVDDPLRSVALLRMLAWLAHAGAAYVFFRLFQRGVGAWAAAAGAVALLATANATDLHAAPLPNHFVMALAVVAFAAVVAGLRGRRGVFFLSAVVAGALPWVMAHAALVAGALALMALFGQRQRAAPRWGWLLAAATPSAIVLGAYWFWGPFDTLVRTVFGAPLAVLDMRGAGYRFFSADALWRIGLAAPWVVVFLLALAAGAVWLLRVCRAAGAGSALRLAPFLVLGLAAGFGVMAYAKPPAPPEYWVEMAPVVGLLVAVATAKVLGLRVWQRLGSGRMPARVLRGAYASVLAAVLALPVDPWREPRPPLPQAFCKDAAKRWLARLRPGDTVLDATGLCGYQVLETGATSHPPFAFTPMWLRQLDQPWIGTALAGDGSLEAAAKRLRTALGLQDKQDEDAPRAAALLLADNRLLRQIRHRGWAPALHREWRMAWFQRLQPGSAPGQRSHEEAATPASGVDEDAPFRSLAILVRRCWERAACGDGPAE